jgi:hypothetical protein
MVLKVSILKSHGSSSITGRLSFPHPRSLIGESARLGGVATNVREKKQSNTPPQLFVGHVSTNKNLGTGEIPQLLLLYCTYSRTIRPVQSLVSILLLHNQSFVQFSFLFSNSA